nr:MAG TPA: hypothetical protein [Caudoviricetes sp.]
MPCKLMSVRELIWLTARTCCLLIAKPLRWL